MEKKPLRRKDVAANSRARDESLAHAYKHACHTQKHTGMLQLTSQQGAEVGKLSDLAGQLSDGVRDEMGRGRQQHAETQEGAKSIQENIDLLLGKLDELQKSILALQALGTQLSNADRDQSRTEETDARQARQFVAELQPQVEAVVSMRGSLDTLASKLQVMIQQVSQQASAATDQLSVLQNQVSGQSDSINAVNDRMVHIGNDQEALSSTDDSSHSDMETSLQPLRAELEIATGYVDEFGALRTRAQMIMSNLSSFTKEIGGESNAWRQQAEKRLASIKQRLDEHLLSESKDRSQLRGAVETLQRRIDSMRGFKSDTLSLDQQLRAQISDTTQALGILDAKFSTQGDELSGKFGALQQSMEGAVDGNSVKRVLDEVQMKYEAVSHNIDDLERELGLLERRERNNKIDSDAVRKSLTELDRKLDSTLLGYENHIAQHPPLFDQVQFLVTSTPPPETTPPPPLPSLDRLPPPISLKWWGHRTSQQNVMPINDFGAQLKLDRFTDGFIEGELILPLYGNWMLQFYFAGPGYDAAAPEARCGT